MNSKPHFSEWGFFVNMSFAFSFLLMCHVVSANLPQNILYSLCPPLVLSLVIRKETRALLRIVPPPVIELCRGRISMTSR